MSTTAQEALTPQDYEIIKQILKKNPGITNDEVIEVFEDYKKGIADWNATEDEQVPKEGGQTMVKVLKVLGVLALIVVGLAIIGFALANIWLVVGVLLAILLLGMIIRMWII